LLLLLLLTFATFVAHPTTGTVTTSSASTVVSNETAALSNLEAVLANVLTDPTLSNFMNTLNTLQPNPQFSTEQQSQPPPTSSTTAPTAANATAVGGSSTSMIVPDSAQTLTSTSQIDLFNILANLHNLNKQLTTGSSSGEATSTSTTISYNSEERPKT
jgi:hypothetical protein